jgi:hypothetical protein
MSWNIESFPAGKVASCSMEKLTQTPPWLPILNALHLEWRMSEILKGNDPDPVIEAKLREAGKWPIDQETRH